MSTIASPRPSITLSSRRTSTSTDTTTRSQSTSRQPAPPAAHQRRNRAALRDYYGLKEDAGKEKADSNDTLPLEPAAPESALDKPDFNADNYVKELLSTNGLESILRTEAGLVGDIRGLDGERKALVYDNYSKLIGVTDTIRKMRANMDPLTPTTSTLTPAISHIAMTASSISSSNMKDGTDAVSDIQGLSSIQRQQRTVQWVLDSPDRLKTLYASGRKEDARNDWTQISQLLNRWQGVTGVEDVRQQCEQIMSQQDRD